MELRDHPLLLYRGLSSWPPIWTWIDGQEDKNPRGEIGVLREVKLSAMKPYDKCFFVIDHDGSTYMGCLLVSDPAFCTQLVELLKEHYGQSIRDVGDIDLSRTL